MEFEYSSEKRGLRKIKRRYHPDDAFFFLGNQDRSVFYSKMRYLSYLAGRELWAQQATIEVDATEKKKGGESMEVVQYFALEISIILKTVQRR